MFESNIAQTFVVAGLILFSCGALILIGAWIASRNHRKLNDELQRKLNYANYTVGETFKTNDELLALAQAYETVLSQIPGEDRTLTALKEWVLSHANRDAEIEQILDDDSHGMIEESTVIAMALHMARAEWAAIVEKDTDGPAFVRLLNTSDENILEMDSSIIQNTPLLAKSYLSLLQEKQRTNIKLSDLHRRVLRQAPHGSDCRPTEDGDKCTCWKKSFFDAING